MNNKPTIKIGGRDIPLQFTVFENIAVQEELDCTGYEIREKVFGIEEIQNDEAKDPEYKMNLITDPKLMKKFGILVRIMGNAALEEMGEEPDLTEKWVLRNIKPGMLIIYAYAIMAVINEANRMESNDEKKGPVDETLEEENAKKQPGN